MLSAGEVYRRICPVDLSRVLPLLPGLPFFAAGLSDPKKYPCDVVLASQFPQELREFADSLGIGGRPARMLLRKLRARQSIPVHVDDWMSDQSDWRRFQVPLTSHQDIVMRWPDDGQEVHLAPGWLWEVRYDRPHEVVHGADVERIHLQIDQVGASI